jgi:hypothetical protein
MRLFDRYPTLKTVIVNTPDYSFRGVLWRRRGEYLVLRNAEMIKTKGETVPLDGEVLIPTGRVQFLQVVA